MLKYAGLPGTFVGPGASEKNGGPDDVIIKLQAERPENLDPIKMNPLYSF